MAITDKKTGPWGLDQVYNKINQGSIWNYYLLSEQPGALYAWGQNERGNLGLNDRDMRSSPTQVGSGTDWASVLKNGFSSSAGGAIKSDGTLWTWGRNEDGAMGINAGDIDYSSPVQVPGTTWSHGAMGDKQMYVIRTDGTLWCWGSNGNGMLGQNQANAQLARVSSPVQIPGTTWAYITSGWSSVWGTKTDGTLWAWGGNTKGELGQNNTTKYSSPVQIPGTTWTMTRNNHTSSRVVRVIKTDGTLWSWGYNGQAALGLNDKTQRSSPTQIPGTDWSSIGGDAYCGLGVKTDGTLWTWGYNDKGNLGHNDRTYRSSPIQVGSDTNWDIATATGGLSTPVYALKTDGTFWSWGYGSQGQLGHNNQTQYSSPIQIPGTWLTNPTHFISAVNASAMSIKPSA